MICNDFCILLIDNWIVVNVLIGLGYEFGDNMICLMMVYIYDMLKQGCGLILVFDLVNGFFGYNNYSGLCFQQNINWFECQLVEMQLVGEFKLIDVLKFDVCGVYVNLKCNVFYEWQFDYLCLVIIMIGLLIMVQDFNGLVGVQCNGVYQVMLCFLLFVLIIFSELSENFYIGQGDFIYKLNIEWLFMLLMGYFYLDIKCMLMWLIFNYQMLVGGGFVLGYLINLLWLDYLLLIDVLNVIGMQLQFVMQNGVYEYDVVLCIYVGYVQVEVEVIDGVCVMIGVCYEIVKELVMLIGVIIMQMWFNNDYFLLVVMLIWNFVNDMQVCVSVLKMILWLQFCELVLQQFCDFELDWLFFGNLLLIDLKFYNFEVCYEWFFVCDQCFMFGGFYKWIDNLIEQVGFYIGFDDWFQIGFINLFKVMLYGGEVEVQKYVLFDVFGSDFFVIWCVLFIVNYIYMKLLIIVDDICVLSVQIQVVGVCLVNFVCVCDQFCDGGLLIGQLDYLVNLQVGFEDIVLLLQIILLFNYVSDCVINCGLVNFGGGFQFDIIEKLGICLDLVVCQGFEVVGGKWELKVEVCNLIGMCYEEGQIFDSGKVVYVNCYKQGWVFMFGVSMMF